MPSTTEERVTPNGILVPPVIVPVAAPVHVGAAAVAFAYAIEVLADSADSMSSNELAEADACATKYEQVMLEAGWRMMGPYGGEWKVVSS